jgi:hypothetical protein
LKKEKLGLAKTLDNPVTKQNLLDKPGHRPILLNSPSNTNKQAIKRKNTHFAEDVRSPENR